MPGTHLLRNGEGDWNDTLQPADPSLKDRMVSSWTVALLFHQLRRYAAILRRAGQLPAAGLLESLAENIRIDFNRYLISGDVLAGYAVFDANGEVSELLLHPSDKKTGVSYSLIAMTCGITGGLFSPAEGRHHLTLIRDHLLFPDGARLMDKPVPYHGGVERIFRRAESAAFFGREVGLMYVHAHLRYCESLTILGEASAVWESLQLVNPISATALSGNATLRQRNSYFSSSDAAFNSRYEADEAWSRVREGTIEVDGGWRIYSGGPGLYIKLLLANAGGRPPG
ncbi:MAG: hypothetical protein HY765_00115 [Rhodomicrobium sp.]|nr:hypothetical protein [Rhodomicrobium sp.]